MKKYLSYMLVLLALVLPGLVMEADAAEIVDSGNCGENITWILDDAGTLTISGTGDMVDFGWMEGGLWFDNRDSVISVVIENGVTGIGDYAFYRCTNLTSVTIPNSVTHIGGDVFMSCASLSSIAIPDGVTSIGRYAFAHCDRLSTVTIPGSVTSIGEDAFYESNNLSGIWVAVGNRNYFSDDAGVLFDKNKAQLIRAPKTLDGSYSVPDGIADIGEYAFAHCENLDVITLPDSVTTISACAFIWCKSLSSITIPDSVTTIVAYAFAECGSLSNITIPEGITSIGDYTFLGCEGLHTITIPDSVVAIGRDAFARCKNLETVYYGGTEAQKTQISVFENNIALINANWHYCPKPFVDVTVGAYYYDPVLWAVNKSITNGTSATTFSPNGTCTRGQIVTFLWRACGSPEPTSSSNPFWDVHSSDYFYKAVLWAVENGITSGMGDGSFAPGAPCTRGQVATFLWRSEGQPDANAANSFYDVAPSAYYYDAVLWAVENGITNGMGDGIFAPDAPCTRGQIVTFLYRAEGFDRVEAPITIQYTHNLVDRSYYNPAGLLRILYTYNKVEVLGQAAKEINARIEQDADAFFSRLTQEDLEEYAASPWLEAGDYFWYTAETEVTNNSDGVFSICVATDWMMGGVHNLDYHGLNFDMNTGNEIDLAVLLEMDEAGLTEKLKDIAWAYLSQNYKDAMYEEAYETLYGYAYEDFLYYFRDNQLILTFPTYALGYGASGAFTVPTGIYIP